MVSDAQPNFIAQLQSRFEAPLPGKTAHDAMMHLHRSELLEPPADARLAAVLICLYETADGEWHFPLIMRASRAERDRHRGQIGLPGGKAEPTDANFEATALREAHEEVNILPPTVQMLGALTPLYIPVSNFTVHPFVAFSPLIPNFIPQIEEVDAVLPTPVSWLLDASLLSQEDLQLPDLDFLMASVPCFNFHGHRVWGATAMILSEFRQMLS